MSELVTFISDNKRSRHSGRCRQCDQPIAAKVHAQVRQAERGKPYGPSRNVSVSLCEKHAIELFLELEDRFPA